MRIQRFASDLSRFTIYQGFHFRSVKRQMSSLAQQELLFTWGANEGGTLGVGDVAERHISRPHLVQQATEEPQREQIRGVSCGHGTTVFFTDRSLFAAGVNSDGRLGCGRHGSNGILTRFTEVALPPCAVKDSVTSVHVGKAHSILVTRRAVYACGSNALGQCGLGEGVRGTSTFRPVPLPMPRDQLSQVVAGLDHTLLLDRSGRVYACGWGADGQTGLGDTAVSCTFAAVNGALSRVRVVQLSSCADTTMALTDDGAVFAWGNNEYGQVDSGSDELQICSPVAISAVDGGRVTDIAAGGAHCLILDEFHRAFVRGFGVLGIGAGRREASYWSRIHFDHLETDDYVTKVESGPAFSAALTQNGRLFMWGRGAQGRLGQSERAATCDLDEPALVPFDGHRVVACHLGVDHVAAIATCN